jgi:hypothetical protein
MNIFLYLKSLIRLSIPRSFKASLSLITFTCCATIFLMHSTASAAAGPIPIGETGSYPRSSGQFPTSGVNTPTGSNLGFAGAADIVNQGGAPIEDINNGYYLWCPNGEHAIEADNNNCSSSQVLDNGINEWGFRPQGVLGSGSDYDLILNQNLVSIGVKVTIVGGCKDVYDSAGFEDHSPTSLSQGGNNTNDDLTAGAYALDGNTQYSDQDYCSGGNEVLPISPSDFTSSNSLGPNYAEVLIRVSLPNNGSVAGKVFGVQTSAGYIGPADITLNPNSGGRLYTNLEDQISDNLYNTQQDCHPNNPSYCPSNSTGGYSAWTRGDPTSPDTDNTANTYNYYFSPDCSYKGGNVTLSWRDGQGVPDSGPGSTQLGEGGTQDPHELWNLIDTTTGKTVYGPVFYPQLSNTSMPVGSLTPGDTYDWQWQDVSRAHGISVQLPYSEFTATNAFNSATDCTKQWNLNGISSVNPGQLNTTNQTATFTHYVQNDVQSQNQASFNWQIQGDYNNGGWNVENDGDGGDNNGAVPFSNSYCASGIASNKNCLRSGSSTLNPGASTNAETETYKFPANASPGAVYCERIAYDYAAGPSDTSYTPDSAVCTTYNPSPGSTCSWLGVDNTNTAAPTLNGDNYNSKSSVSVNISELFNNSGGTTWNKNYYIKYIGNNGSIDGSDNYLSNTVYPGGNTNELTLSFGNNDNNPSGQYDFQMVNDQGNRFGAICGVHITWPPPPCKGTECEGTAVCSTTVAGDGPNGIVTDDGGALRVTITVTDTSKYTIPSSLDGSALGTYSGGIAGEYGVTQMGYDAYDHANPPPGNFTSNNSYGPDGFGTGLGTIVPGTPAQVTVTLTEPTTLNNALVGNFAHVSLGKYNVTSSPCGVGFVTYAPFNIKAVPLDNFNPNNDEDPTSFTYSAYADETGNNNGVNNDPVSACAYIEPYNNGCPGTGVDIIGNNSSAGTWTGTPTYLLNGNRPITTYNAGDSYCVDMYVAVSSGYVDSGGNISPYGQGGPNGVGPICQTIDNKPYVKVYNSGVSSGGEFEKNFVSSTPTSCSGGGALAGWNNDSGAYPDGGSGSQLSNFALNNIYGFASAQPDNISNTSRSWTDLNFADQVPTDPISQESSPNLGGTFGAGLPGPYASNCLTSPLEDPVKTTLETTPATVNVGTDGGLNSGAYRYNGNITLSGDSSAGLAPGDNLTIFVNGNVYINGNIKYDTAQPWTVTVSPQGATANTVPSFQLVVSGNIYIDPSVSNLDGTYYAEYATAGDSNGRIFTCANQNGPIDYGSPSDFYSTCARQLVVNGSFVADKVNLQRTYGSLRDSVGHENENPNSPARTCSNNSLTPSSSTCAAEVFNFSPESYISNYESQTTCSTSPCSVSLSGEPPIL